MHIKSRDGHVEKTCMVKWGGTIHKRGVLHFDLSNEEEDRIFPDAVYSCLNARMMSLNVGNWFKFLGERT